MLEQECDIVLARFANKIVLNDPHAIFEESDKEAYLKEHFFNFPMMTLRHVFTIFTDAGFIEYFPGEKIGVWRITDKGESFYYTDSFADRRKRWDVDRKVKEQQLQLNKLELVFKPYTFSIAVAGLLLAIVALVVSLLKHR